eukprot:10140748-Alexandrium_andersonii.AAC.1
MIEKFRTDTLDPKAEMKIVANWGRKKGTMVAQRRMDLAEQVLECSTTANALIKVAEDFNAVRPGNESSASSE